jgi:hypothetical protein
MQEALMRASTLAFVALTLAASPALAGGGRVEWTNDLERGLTRAHDDRKATMIYFTADW